ncbi:MULTISPECIES: hypothetical protein [unclassified Serratia (in: enterobacteria)]|uniref:hypothetical protein n=1 Tax=unclassified Serratia (in: enterobacteria) TaxID=2647522 RepID=UPI0015F64317|nr:MULTISPECIES: hypothetical protein [unclassified Serratia (in: enterobacteria)]
MIATILSNEYVSAFGYVVGVISGCIAIYQTVQLNSSNRKVEQLEVTIEELNAKITNNENNVIQGERSQYFQDNNGPVNIDNRG